MGELGKTSTNIDTCLFKHFFKTNFPEKAVKDKKKSPKWSYLSEAPHHQTET